MKLRQEMWVRLRKLVWNGLRMIMSFVILLDQENFVILVLVEFDWHLDLLSDRFEAILAEDFPAEMVIL